ncbi:MAG: hypothetical protein M3O35_06700 [Acidobacteriota bacterium]|nr:hypothetical protein [Acidobacteriota bacterium]
MSAALLLAGADKSSVSKYNPAISGLTLNSSPQTTGVCPFVNVLVKGSFNSTGPVTITYAWIKGTGKRETIGKSAQEKFPSGGKHHIETTWRVNGSFTGWMAYKILWPVRLQSNRASFVVNCGK